ncbi:MAG: diacylglycerol kinase family lipid kinase [Clostridiales bacterium]|jgi:YegS/Rv2252/BmrU family lipid kinase|nr:diacylglycerol kinase family lipid kinase [Clostridiales bacterium]
MKHVFIVNPTAGKGKLQGKFCRSVREYFKSNSIKHEIYISQSPGDATRFARETARRGGRLRFYACGGDGTLYEVINGAYDCENVEFAVVPLGSGNDFARTFGVNGMSPFFDVARQVGGVARPIDVIRSGSRVAVNICSLGFDAEVAANIPRFKRLPLVSGSLAYFMSIIYCLFGKVRNGLEITIDGGETIRGDFVFAVAANGRWYGGGFKAAPLALCDDGLLDIILVEAVSRLRMLGLIKTFRQGEILTEDVCRFFRCKRVEIRSKRPASINTDGECEPGMSATFEVIPGSLRFSIPEGVDVPLPAPMSLGAERFAESV